MKTPPAIVLEAAQAVGYYFTRGGFTSHCSPPHCPQHRDRRATPRRSTSPDEVQARADAYRAHLADVERPFRAQAS